jgi:hypothetical protein
MATSPQSRRLGLWLATVLEHAWSRSQSSEAPVGQRCLLGHVSCIWLRELEPWWLGRQTRQHVQCGALPASANASVCS